MKIRFHKYHGTGNDFILIDNRTNLLTGAEHGLFKEMCDRHFGIGADGLILLTEDPGTDFQMDYFNSDGNRSSMCGNGGRCIVKFAQSLGLVSSAVRFMATDGLHKASIDEDFVKLEMITPYDYRHLGSQDYFIHTGSPHYVRFMDSPVEELDVYQEGRKVRYSNEWREEGTNVNFVNVRPDESLFVRTYERGVEDETLSCGTGVTAVGMIHRMLNPHLPDPVKIETPGGQLKIHTQTDKPWLEGPAVKVFEGLYEG